MLTITQKILQALGTVPLSQRQICDAIGHPYIMTELESLIEDEEVLREKEWLTEMEKHEKGLPLNQPKFRWIYTRVF